MRTPKTIASTAVLLCLADARRHRYINIMRALFLGLLATSLALSQNLVTGAGGSAYTTVTFSATPIFTIKAGTSIQTFQITLTGNVTGSTLTTTSATIGQDIAFKVCQDATGSRTFTWPSNVVNPGYVDPTASTCNKQIFRWDGTNAVSVANMESDGCCGILTSTGLSFGLPATSDTLVGIAATQTLTNKSIAASEVNSGTLPTAQMPALTGDVTTSSGAVATTLTSSGIKNAEYCSDTGSANALACSPTNAYGAYTTGTALRVKVANANTGATTINVNSLGTKNVTKNGTTALASGDLAAGGIYLMTYDGTEFVVTQNLGSGGSGSAIGAAITGGCGGSATAGANSTLTNLGLNPASGACSTAPNSTNIAFGYMATRACTLQHLYVFSGVAGASASDGIVTVYTGVPNATPTASSITCTIGTGQTCNDTTHTAALAAGSMVNVFIAAATGTTSIGYMTASLECN